MVQIGFIICEVAFWVMNMLFVHKEDRKTHFPVTIGGTSVFVSIAIIVCSMFCRQDVLFWDVFAQCLIAAIVLLFIKINWHISTSVAVYNIIWARIMWWLLTEVWKFFVTIMEYYVGTALDWGVSVLLIIFYTISILVASKTIVRWIPDDGKKHIGPRQLISAILLSMIFEIIAYMPEIRSVKSGIDRWMVLFLLQIICAIILYLQNELFRKSMMKQELELMNVLLERNRSSIVSQKKTLRLSIKSVMI